ncbi:TPA: hypothetical protein EYP44_04595, partial [Candidatus Bathyarchaeota archaeon]|nr:hypothetical protein [Candidatus Bathyarchaeota archaeon]
MPRGRSLLTALALSAIAVLAIAYGVTVGSRGRRIIVATTTSLYDTGLLDAVEREFEGLYGGDLCFISVGTGLALEHAERGDADAVLVHAPVLEFGFLARGQGVVRK